MSRRTVYLAPDDHRHGTEYGYNRCGCSCPDCREANNAAHRRRCANPPLSRKVGGYAALQAIKWVRVHHPDVWAEFYEQARSLFGERKPGRQPLGQPVGPPPSRKARSHADAATAKWVRHNHPDVWAMFRARARLLFGSDKSCWPAKSGESS
jgi:hypothetical protein